MFKYIKWELKNFFSNKLYLGLFIISVYLFVIIFGLETNNPISNLFYFLYIIVLFVTLYGSFWIGTKRVINSFSNKTFLLESMIPYPVKKILGAKYMLGIIISLIFSFTGIVGIIILFAKAIGIQVIQDLIKEIYNNVSLSTFIRFSILYILVTIACMSIIIFCFVLVKAFKPSGKGNKFLGILISFIFFYFLFYILINLNIQPKSVELFVDFLSLGLIIIMYFSTAWLIENKLEIYN